MTGRPGRAIGIVSNTGKHFDSFTFKWFYLFLRHHTRYAFKSVDGSMVYDEKELNSLMLRQIRALSNVRTNETTFFMGAFTPMSNQLLYYKDLHDITPLELRRFTTNAAETFVMVSEHEAVHIVAGVNDDPEGEGVANFWAGEALNAYRANQSGGH